MSPTVNAVLCSVLLVVLRMIAGVCCIQLLQVSVPSVIQAGEGAQLLCDVDMEGERIYSVKWYKDNEEFFRYVPRENANQSIVYDVQGIHVNKTHSNYKKVLLGRVTLASSGHYRCEVSAEAPSFSSVSGGGNMEVVYLPGDRPVISGGKSNYRPGDPVDVNCTSAASKPAARIQWFINDKKANANLMRQYKLASGEEGLETTVVALAFTVKESHLRDGKMTLRCMATVTPEVTVPPGSAGTAHGQPHGGSGSTNPSLNSAAASTASLASSSASATSSATSGRLGKQQPVMESMEVRLEASSSSARSRGAGGWMLLSLAAASLLGRLAA